MTEFKKISPDNLTRSTFELIGKKWMLIMTKNDDKYNVMTASWGGLGYLWNKPVAFIFIRPQRFTYELLEKTPTFSLSFFDEEYKEKLSLCGKLSGKKVDKISMCNFNVCSDENIAFIEEANLAITCKKIYAADINEQGFIDKTLLSNYNNDFHRMYIAEIDGIYEK